MAGIQNNTARQFNIRSTNKETGSTVTVRLKPLFNVVPDELWNAVKDDQFTKNLAAKGWIDFSKAKTRAAGKKEEVAMTKVARKPKAKKTAAEA